MDKIVSFFSSLLLIFFPQQKIISPVITPPVEVKEIVYQPTPTISSSLVIVSSTTTLSPTKVLLFNSPTIIPTKIPTPTEIPLLKACFTYYGEGVKGEEIYFHKKVTFDASCSENAKSVKWYVDNHLLDDKIFKSQSFSNAPPDAEKIDDYKFTLCRMGCNPPRPDLGAHDDLEFKLVVTGENKEEKSYLKKIHFIR